MGIKSVALPYNIPVAKYVRQAVQDGVQIKDILATVNKRFQNSPRNSATFYKLYGEDIAEARAEISGRVGNVVINQALNGHFPSQDLYLRSKAGWSPKESIQTEEVHGDEDENSSAVDSLMALLGKDVPDETEESSD